MRRLLNQVEKGKVHIESLQTGWQTEPFPGAVPVWRATLTLAAHVYSGNGKHRHRRFRGKRGRR